MPAITRIANPFLAVEVATLGAEMQSLTSSDGTQWLWNGDPAWWNGRSPILFPIVGKAPDGHVTIDGHTYPMAQHGFARRSDFVLTTANDIMCRYELTANDATRAIYPFEFCLAVTHALFGRRLTVEAEVENRDTRPMPFGLGYHPAFLWPLPGAAGRPHAVILDNAAEPPRIGLDNGLTLPQRLPSSFTKGHLALDHSLFDADALIFPEGAGNGLTYAAQDGPALKFTFDNLPNLALWQKPGAPFLCIEPWHGMAAQSGGSSELAQRPYATVLPPAQKARFTFTVEVPA